MRYMIDLSTETDVLLFKQLGRKLKERGHQVQFTTREFMGIEKLAERHGIKPHVIGSHGGGSLYGKLKAGAERTDKLADFCNIGGVEAVISNSNPEACRVGFGLGLKVFSWNDSPDLQEAQTKLTAPLSDWIFTPWVVPERCFEWLGVTHDRIFQYGALHPMAWLPEVDVDRDITSKLSLDPDRPIVFFRESETKSAYLGKRDLAIEAVMELSLRNPHWQFVTKPRYSLKDLFEKGYHPSRDTILPFREPIDAQSLLAASSLFISGGGTMAIEAAYYGVPTISTREKTTFYDHFLNQEKLVERAETVEQAVKLAERMVQNREHKRVPDVFSKMKYPLDEIVSILEGEHG